MIMSKLISAFKNAEFISTVVSADGTIFAVSSNSSTLFKIDGERYELIDSFSLPSEVRPREMIFMEDSTLLIATDKGVYNVNKSGKKLWNYSVKTMHLASDSLRYFFYTTSIGQLGIANSVIRFDTYTGREDTIFTEKKDAIESIVLDGDSIYVLLSKYGNLTLKSGSVKKYIPKILFTTVNLGANKLAVSDSIISIFSGRRLLNIDQKGMKKSSQFSVLESSSMSKVADGKFLFVGVDGVLRVVKR